jgi:hypothetical protein
LGKRVRNPACDHDNNVNHHHYYDHYCRANNHYDEHEHNYDDDHDYLNDDHNHNHPGCPWLISIPGNLRAFLMN